MNTKRIGAGDLGMANGLVALALAVVVAYGCNSDGRAAPGDSLPRSAIDGGTDSGRRDSGVDAGHDSGGDASVSECPDLAPVGSDKLVVSEIGLADFVELFNPRSVPTNTDGIRLFENGVEVSVPSMAVPGRSYIVIDTPSLNLRRDRGELAMFRVMVGDLDPGGRDQMVDYVCYGAEDFAETRSAAMRAGGDPPLWEGGCTPPVSLGGAVRRLPGTDGMRAESYDATASIERTTCTVATD